METFAILFQIGIWTFTATALIYLLFRRIDIRDKEDFEKRDN